MWRTVVFIALIGGPGAAQPPSPTSRTDSEGVALPAEAIARLGSTRFWHADMIQPGRFSADGRTLFVGTVNRDGLYAWDVATGRLRWRTAFGDSAENTTKFGRSLEPRDIGFIGTRVAILLPDDQKPEWVVQFDAATGKLLLLSSNKIGDRLPIPGCNRRLPPHPKPLPRKKAGGEGARKSPLTAPEVSP